MEYAGVDHVLIVVVLFLATGLASLPAEPRFPSGWIDSERCRKALPRAYAALRSLGTILDEASSPIIALRNADRAAQQWCLDVAAWLQELAVAVVRDTR